MSMLSESILEFRIYGLENRLAGKQTELGTLNAAKDACVELMQKRDASPTDIERAVAEFDENIAEVEARIAKLHAKLTAFTVDLRETRGNQHAPASTGVEGDNE